MPDPAEDSAITALQRAMVGPLGSDHYLPIFARFEAADRAGPGWNWAAALCTLNWMLFRRLWGPALMYLGGLAAASLLVFGVGRLLLHLSPPEELSLLVSLATIAVLVPGGLGDAWLYRQYRDRSARALAAAPTLQEACALLALQASSRRRLLVIAICNVLLAAAVASAWLAWTHRSRLPLPTPASAPEPARSAGGPVTPALAASSARDAASVTAARASMAVAVPERASSTAASAPVSTPPPVSPPVSTPASSPPLTPASAPGPATAPAVPASGPASAASAPVTAVASTSPAMPVSAAMDSMPRTAAPEMAVAHPAWYPRAGAMAAYVPRRRPAPPPAPSSDAPASAAQPSSSAASAALAPRGPAIAAKRPLTPATPTAPPVQPAAAKASDATPSTGSGRYVVNIGLYAQPANAQRVQATLREAGVRLLVQELDMPNGPRTRIRAGPYATRAQADAAAARIRALQLEAVVARE